MTEDVITELQTKIAYQEDSIQELGTVVIAMQKQIDQLELVCQELKVRLREASAMSSGIADEEEKPPHY